jgi:hypothetical protein
MKTAKVLVSWSSCFWKSARISPATRFFCKDFARIGRRKHERDPRIFSSNRLREGGFFRRGKPSVSPLGGGKIEKGRMFHSPVAFDCRCGSIKLGFAGNSSMR